MSKSKSIKIKRERKRKSITPSPLHPSTPSDFTKYDQRLEFILRTASCIFAEKGFHSTTMRDISRATEISLAGLYHYFKSKDDILFLIQDNCFGHVVERLEECLKETHSPIERLRIVIENHLSFFAANMAEMKVLSHEAETLNGEKYEHISNKKQEYTRLVRNILAEINKQNANGKGKVDLTVATYALFGMMNWIYNWYDPDGKLKVNELSHNITRLFLGGFLAGNFKDEIQLTPKSRKAEKLSVWRAA